MSEKITGPSNPEQAYRLAEAEEMVRRSATVEAFLGLNPGDVEARAAAASAAAEKGLYQHGGKDAGEQTALRKLHLELPRELARRTGLETDRTGYVASSPEVADTVSRLVNAAVDKTGQITEGLVRDVSGNRTPKEAYLDGPATIDVPASSGAQEVHAFDASTESLQTQSAILEMLGVTQEELSTAEVARSGSDGEFGIAWRVVPTEVPGILLRAETWKGIADAGRGTETFSRLAVVPALSRNTTTTQRG